MEGVTGFPMAYSGGCCVTNIDVPVVVCVTLPPDLHKALLVRIKKLKIAKAEGVRLALREYLFPKGLNE